LPKQNPATPISGSLIYPGGLCLTHIVETYVRLVANAYQQFCHFTQACFFMIEKNVNLFPAEIYFTAYNRFIEL
jgi:hypothetical protein